MDNRVQLVVVRNPFDRRIRDERLLSFDTMPTVAELVRESLPLSPDISVAINGEVITAEEWETRHLCAGDQLVALPVLHKGVKQLLGAIAMIALIVWQPEIAAYIGTTLGISGTALTLTMMGINLIGARLIGALVGTQKQNLPGSLASSQAYGWSPATMQQPGGPVVRAYGRVKLYGNIISGYIENTGDTGATSTADLLIDLGSGPYFYLDTFQINDQPVEYYTGVTLDCRAGNVNQDVIPAFNDTSLTIPVNTKVVYGTPLVRATDGNHYDGMEVVITFPLGLGSYNDTGGLDDVDVYLTVQISANGGSTWVDIADPAGTKVSGASTTVIRKTFKASNLSRGTRYLVKVTKWSSQVAKRTYNNDMYLGEIHEILYDDFQYPRTVLAAVRALASDQLSGSIKFSCMAYAAIIRVWTGSSWISSWSNNPAWVCRDVLTQPVLNNDLTVARYDGMDPSRLDLPAFLAWALWCDELVPNGLGGSEPRCFFDGIFDTTSSLWESALEVATNARAQLILRGTTVSVVFDGPRATAAQMFTVGNTAVASFRETFLPMADRAAAVEIDYNNMTLDYQRDRLTLVNPVISESSAQRLQVSLRGVTRPSQAAREGTYMLGRNQYIGRTAEITVDIDALACTVGDKILLQDDVTRWGEGGRAAAGSTTSTLVIDHPITLEQGKTYEVRVRLADDTLLTRTVTTAWGIVSYLTVSVDFPSAPGLYDVWALGETGKAVKEFLITDIVRNGDQQAKLSLVEYNSSLYGLDFGKPPIVPPDVSSLTDFPVIVMPSLSGVTAEEIVTVAADGTVLIDLYIRYTLSNGMKVVIREAGQKLAEVSSGVFRYANVQAGKTYTLTLQPIYSLGQVVAEAAAVTISHTVIGKIAKPTPVSGVTVTTPPVPGVGITVSPPAPPAVVTTATITGNIDTLSISWASVPDKDLAEYEIRQGGSDWLSATLVTKVRATSATILNPGMGVWTYRIRAVDTSGNYSASDAIVNLTISSGIAAKPGQITSDAQVTLDGLGNAVIAFKKYDDPQIASYELRTGDGFDTGTLVASTTSSSFTLPLLSAAGRVYWIKGVYAAGGYSVLQYRIDFGGDQLAPPSKLSWSVSEPNLVFSWGAVAGATQYLTLFEVGGVTSIKVVVTPEVTYPIPKYAAVFRVVAVAGNGGMSGFVDEDISITGQYHYNEIVNVALPITTGQYINLAFIGSNTVTRASLLGVDPVAPYVENVNDGDLYGFGYNLQNLATSAIQSIQTSWFRQGFWKEQNGYFESAVVDLGAILTGALSLNLTKTVTYVGDSAMSAYAQVNTGYMADSTIPGLIDHKAFLSVRFMTATDSPQSGAWKEQQNGNWVTARYVKLVVDVAMASPLTKIEVTAGAITIDVPDVTEDGTKTGVTSAGSAITFAKTYNHVSVVITGAQGSPKSWADSATITLTGCTLYTDSGTPCAVNYFVKGY